MESSSQTLTDGITNQLVWEKVYRLFVRFDCVFIWIGENAGKQSRALALRECGARRVGDMRARPLYIWLRSKV